MSENEKVLTIVDAALELYGSRELSVDKTDDGMIDVNVVERHLEAQPYFAAVARYDKCDLGNLKTELNNRNVCYYL